MSKKVLVIFCLVSFIFLPVFSSYAQEGNLATESAEEEYDFASMTTYELFWPIVAGKVPGDRLYSLKIWRDKFIGLLIFSNLKKSEYLKNLANKRLVETEKLLEIGRESYFPETIEKSRNHLEEGLILLFEAPETEPRFWLRSEYAKDLKKHLIVLERMRERVGESQRGVFEESIEKINEWISEYKLEV